MCGATHFSTELSLQNLREERKISDLAHKKKEKRIKKMWLPHLIFNPKCEISR